MKTHVESKAEHDRGQTQELQKLLNFYHGTDGGKTKSFALSFRSLIMLTYWKPGLKHSDARAIVIGMRPCIPCSLLLPLAGPTRRGDAKEVRATHPLRTRVPTSI